MDTSLIILCSMTQLCCDIFINRVLPLSAKEEARWMAKSHNVLRFTEHNLPMTLKEVTHFGTEFLFPRQRSFALLYVISF